MTINSEAKIVFQPTLVVTGAELVEYCKTHELAVSNAAFRDYCLEAFATMSLKKFFRKGSVKLQLDDGSTIDFLLSNKEVIGDANQLQRKPGGHEGEFVDDDSI